MTDGIKPELQKPPEGLAEDLHNLYYRIEEDGFDYTMARYSDWSEIKSSTFHTKLAAYLKARRELLKTLMLEPYR